MLTNGTAFGTCDCYTLTTTTSQAGSVWAPTSIDLNLPFDFTSSVHLGASDGGADGMAFVLRQSGTFTGTGGGQLGYGGILNSVAIEIDTWNNGWAGEIASDHLGMHSNGVLTHNLVPATAIANIEDGDFHDFRVRWDPVTTEMDVFLDGALIFTYTGDLVTSVFGGVSNVRWGWTGATGGAWNLQQVCLDMDSEIGVDDISVCPGQTVNFSSLLSSTGLIYDGTSFTDFEWDFGDGTTSDLENPTHVFTTEGTEIVSLTVTNLVGCTDVGYFSIDIDSLDFDVDGSDISCFGLDDGFAEVTGEDGEAPYSYTWDDPMGQTTAMATDLVAGLYSVTVVDDAGCENTKYINLTEPNQLLLDELEIVPTICGLETGGVTFHMLGGTPPYEYSLNGGPFQPDSVFTALSDGAYDVLIQDANGCSWDSTVVIVSEELLVTIESTNITCNGFANGTATALPEYGVGPCDYLWDDPLGQTTATATDLAPGTYEVMVTYIASGCSGTAEVTITEPDELLLGDIGFINPSCGIGNGLISLEVSGGTSPYEYSIDDGVTFSDASVFTELWPGVYFVLVRDANGCIVNGSVELINVSNIPDVEFIADPPEGCQVLTVNFENISDPLLTDVTTWHFGDGATGVGSTVTHIYPVPGCYDITIEIQTFDGCDTDSTFEDFICVWELPIADFDFTPDDPDVLDNEVSFENLSVSASTYEWDFGDGSFATDFEPDHSYPQVGNKTYPVELIAITDKGCTDTIVKYISVKDVIQYYIPNAFTPNEDPFNQVFRPVFAESFIPRDYHMAIYNRWGELIWESYDYTAGWDGTYGNVFVEDGVYIWKIVFRENNSDKKHDDYGHITVLK
ncbi:MAG: lectin-like domain-containing protein [Crocinitomicaceae bacterium]